MSDTETSLEELSLLLRAGCKVVAYCSAEEQRALANLKRLAEGAHGMNARDMWIWTHTAGWRDHKGRGTPSKNTADPVGALDWAIERETLQHTPALYVMKDLHPFLSGPNAQPRTIRKLKDLAHTLQRGRGALVLLSGPHLELPAELEKDVEILDLSLPTFDEMRAALDTFIRQNEKHPRVTIRVSPEERDEMAKAALGLTMAEAKLAYSKALCADGRLDGADVRYIVDEKKQIIRKTGSLTFEEPGDLSGVGGLERLKEWLTKRRHILTERARKYGLPAPRGVLLTGIPGCGKTLCARAMASMWRVPLLRLDMGSVYGGLLGSSEANIRKAIACAEAMAPCILMIDEIEKALAGAGGRSTDGGTTPRVFGTLLSWMSDKTLPVFVVATANAFERLPPEMLRKGRFDEIFFVDFPHVGERRAIFEIHLARRGRDPAEFDVDTLVAATSNFTGSEIEQAVIAGMIEAFADDERPFTTDDILTGIRGTVPLFETMRTQVDAIRERAASCTVPASEPRTE